MEQHPVPQNVTTFQFRLIGDMTIKQFGYLAGGAILAYIIYKIPLPFFFTWPLAILSAIGGFGLAFVPIEERPMDVWVLSFIKSIYNPTQYVWQKQTPPVVPPPMPPTGLVSPSATSKTVANTPPPISPAPQPSIPPATNRGDILQHIFVSDGHQTPPQKGAVLTQHVNKGLFSWIADIWAPKPKVNTSPPQSVQHDMSPWSSSPAGHMDYSPPPVVRQAAPAVKTVAQVQQRETVLEEKLKNLQSELQEKTTAESRVLELQTQLTELISEREKMSQELASLRKQSVSSTVTPPTTATTTTTQTPNTPTIQIIQPGRAVKVGLPRLTTFPNIVTGIVKDRDKNLLPGVLVTVKDKEGVPLRALKTNRLGQFAASTQLPNGIYFVETEDPRLRYTFDRAQITLNGTIVPALEIFAKSEKEITRAKLEKELFGKPNI